VSSQIQRTGSSFVFTFVLFLVATSGCTAAEPVATPAAPAEETPIAMPGANPTATAVVIQIPGETPFVPAPQTPRKDFIVQGPDVEQMNRAPAKRTRAELRFGDCLFASPNTSTGGGAPVLQVVACKGPWVVLVLAKLDLPRDITRAAANQRIMEECAPRGGSFFFGPDEPEWAAGDRVVICAITRDLLEPPEPGDCYRARPPLENVRQLLPVYCSLSHNYEAVGAYELTAEDLWLGFPAHVAARCSAAVGEYLGADPEVAKVKVAVDMFVPSDATWDLGDRSFRCFVSLSGAPPVNKPLQGSLRPSY
jgi:Septum formation